MYLVKDLSSVGIDMSEFTSLKWNHLVILDLEDSSIGDDGWNLLAKNAHKYQHLRKIFLSILFDIQTKTKLPISKKQISTIFLSFMH
jgi:hypothetical protein